ncbi:L-aminoadipate-semialdehyde dehydrogenase-phosphopantetheinyl transferase [Varanus komodoensis]|uniref:L-aminoadipate-semialdehyde dehydrogenase-phosphopantetheinyl transferase n=1 Tax=Varanus komodoensis TaxID=61221 RepID=A0A8D2J7V2_VARKO|nr:L-aminoadipate-semialdehyde dehydrogenase-phosphopantetheinyl transferase isoform X1 [Varanus komodoensis]XP_044298216.1 L-aminoadipate-semialdehyde dehydrogenase-phosphopantetheinyl transferase isoform X1 [Varanus komodoensis]KAF7250791.1 L-aminoadipate-semialdehyde dehydrogenase-phosphopantetheinyl transferase [Varanus komodoensis]
MFSRLGHSLDRLAMETVRWAFSYSAWVPCREDWLLAMRLVQPEEKERIEQFVFCRDAKAAMAGRLLIRKVIAEKLNIPWNKIQLHRTSKGKPFLANDLSHSQSSFSFNVSHHGNYSVLAAESDCQVGIDIMKTSLPGSGSVPDFFRIMKRQFTEEEWRMILSMNNEWLQLDMFHRHWALKESFIKAIGVGIGFDLQRIEFNVSSVQLEVGKTYVDTVLLLDGEVEKDWTFEETRLDESHHVAVALGKARPLGEKHDGVLPTCVTPTPFTVLSFDDLVASGVPLAPKDAACWDTFCSKQESPARQSSNPR